MTDWRETIRATVADLPSQAKGIDESSLPLKLRGSLGGLLTKAAHQRGVSPASYARRAVQALLAVDLGIPFETLVEIDPRLVRPTGFPIVDETGKLFGPWEILGFVEVEDERAAD